MWDYILGTELFRAVRIIDLFYMVLTIQCHPYYGGPYMEWKWTIFLMILAGYLASALVSYVISICITPKNALSYMSTISAISIPLYIIAAWVVYSASYKNPWKYFWFFLFEFLKFLVHFGVEEAHIEVIKDACNEKEGDDAHKGDSSDEKYKAISHLSSNLLRSLIFVTSGLALTYFTKDIKMGKLAPYNFVLGFACIAVWFIGCYILFGRARKNKDKGE